MANSLEGHIPYFLSNFLSKPASALPKGAQWVVTFNDLELRILPAIKKALEYEPNKSGWQIERAAKTVLAEDYQKTKGCMFAQAIDVPGESMTAVPDGNIVANNYIRSYVGAGRNPFPIMRMTFLETNTSFVDNFLRPWTIATQNFGLIARAVSTPENYRTDLTCYKLGTRSPTEPVRVMLKMAFYDLCCISVSNEEYNSAPLAGSPIMREAQFVYNSYSVDSDDAFSSEDVPTLGGLPERSEGYLANSPFSSINNDPLDQIQL